jgi:hypothetical protein
LPGSKERSWKVQLDTQPVAIALTWKGYWLGAWWDTSQVRQYLESRKELTESDFAILKWLRIPVLQHDLALSLANRIKGTPCRFLRAWRLNSAIPEGLRPHDHIEGVDFVVRYFLWTQFGASHAREALTTLTHWDGNLTHPERCIGHIDQLACISPILMWQGLKHFLSADPKGTLELLRAFICARLGLPATCNDHQMELRLESLEERASEVVGVSTCRLEELIAKWIKRMHKNDWHPEDCDKEEHHKIGESDYGRQYVSTRICTYWLSKSK